MSQMEKRVHHGPPPGHWESLCPDVRRVVLSKVPLRDLALAAGTCREFRGTFRVCLGEERERLILVAEAQDGKDVVSGFVKSVQDSICGADPYWCRTVDHIEYFIVNAAGEPELVTVGRVLRLMHKGYVAYFVGHRLGADHRLCSSRMVTRNFFQICVTSSGTVGNQVHARLLWDDCEAQMGILLAICTRDHEPVLSRAPRHPESLKTVPAVFWVPETSKEFRGPLGELAETFFYYTL